MYRSLIHYWRMNLAVALGAAVAAAVLTGALVVGDSVRGSLRDLTLERLGGVDLALTGQRFFRQELAAELAERVDGNDDGLGEAPSVEPAILLQGSAVHADTRARASGVGIQGVDDGFLGWFEDGGEAARLWSEADGTASGSARVYPPAVIDEPLRAALGAEPGDHLLISLKRWSEVPRGSLLGRKDTGSVVETVRLRIAGVIPDRGLGSFSLAVHQTSSYNVFVPLAALQKALDQQGTVNSLMVSRRGAEGTDGATLAAVLDRKLQEILQPEDLGIRVEARAGYLSIESQEFILKPSLIRAVDTVALNAEAATLPILTYLVNRFELGDHEVPYSTVTALDLGAIEAGLRGDLGGELVLADGSPATTLGEDEILLNQWTADELGAAVGDRVDLTYFVVGDREDLREETTAFTVAGIVPIAGLAADETLSQEYPGIAGSGNMADWDPPFPIELGRVRPADEEYWDLYRDTPKAFVALDTGRRLWRNRWGDLTAIRVAPAAASVEDLAGRVRRGLVEQIPLAASGLGFQPVKELGLAASGGATDFAGLFVGFSIFIIAAAAMLVALLFSLGVERRVSEVGLLRAVGFPGKRVRGRLLAEGGLLAAAGALAGLAGAVGYAALMIAGLRTWWLPAVGTSRLALHVQPVTLVLGWVASVLVVLLAIWLRLRRLRRVPTPALLANVSEVVDTRSGRRVRWTAVIALSLATILIAVAFATGRSTDPALFGSAGPALLIGLLALFALRLGGSGGGFGNPGKAALLRMAASSGARSRGRSILAATLVASASFLVVTVAAFQTDFSRMELDRESGTGGFTLIGEADVPLLYDPGDPDGRFELGFGSRQEELLTGTEIVPLRLLPGDDTSCLNLYQPTRPRILGVPPALIERGGFSFQKILEDADDPWTLLDLDLGPGVVPAFGDANSMQWILKLGLGDDLVMDDEAGEEIRLRLVGILGTGMEPSIFQSELLISEAAFVRHFPSRSGWSYFLAETPAGADGEQQIGQTLESVLEDYGFDAVGAADKLEAFHSVQNTYLSTFRTLGGLGLLLGTAGLAIVLLRNTTERRGELATLRAFGYRRSTLTWMVVFENALLLLAGLAIGTAAALLTAAPNLLGEASSFPGRAIAGTLAGIFLFGLLACTLAALGALRIPLLPALKAEH